MDDRQLDKVLSAYALQQAKLMEHSTLSQEASDEIEPSEDFLARMQELFDEAKKREKRKKSFKRIGMVAASFILVLSVTFGAVMSADASRSSFIHFFEQYFTISSSKNREWNMEFNAQIRNTVHSCYLPSWLPDGVQSISATQSPQKTTIEYSGNKINLRVIQSADSVKIFSDNEINSMEKVNYAGSSYYYTEKTRESYVRRYIIWNIDGRSIRLESNMSRKDLFKIAENMIYKEG